MNGKDSYRLNGGFKKHFVENPKTTYKNGNNTTINGGKYGGYWIDEGEDILVGGWTSNLNSNWYALDGENYQVFTNNNTFVNLQIDATGVPLYPNHLMGRIDNGYSTTIVISAQMASRIAGKQLYSTNVTIFDEITDNRFYDINGSNRVGIWQTNPEISKNAPNSSFASWWSDVVGGRQVIYAALRIVGASSATGPWTTEWANIGQNLTPIYTANSTYAGGISISTYNQSYLKMSNIAYDIQFKNLWSPLLDGVAYTTADFYGKNPVRPEITDNVNSSIILDENNNSHLSLKAGYPLIKVENGEKVQWTITNKTNKTVNIFGKYGPFSLSDIAPLDDADIEWTNGKESNKKIFELSANGTETIRFDVEEDGIVFLKWVASDGKNATIDVSKNPIVQLPKE